MPPCVSNLLFWTVKCFSVVSSHFVLFFSIYSTVSLYVDYGQPIERERGREGERDMSTRVELKKRVKQILEMRGSI